MGLGTIRLSAGYNLNNTKITDRRVFSGFTAQRLFARQESYRLTDGQPKNKLNFSLDWDYDMFGLTLSTNRYGEVFLPSSFSTASEQQQYRTGTRRCSGRHLPVAQMGHRP
jgi:iron complex outermembrane receptor protein